MSRCPYGSDATPSDVSLIVDRLVLLSSRVVISCHVNRRRRAGRIFGAVTLRVSGVCVLLGALPGRDVHDPHDAPQPLLHHQPHFPVSAHLRCLVPRLLSAGRVRRKGQPRDHDPAGTRRLPADRRRDAAAHA